MVALLCKQLPYLCSLEIRPETQDVAKPVRPVKQEAQGELETTKRPRTHLHPSGPFLADSGSPNCAGRLINIESGLVSLAVGNRGFKRSVTENPGIKPRNTNVVLKGRHSLLQRWMHGG